MDKQALAAINAYNPGLSAAWMFQRSMSVRPNHGTHPQFINRLLGVNFKSMQLRGDWVLKPFLQVTAPMLALLPRVFWSLHCCCKPTSLLPMLLSMLCWDQTVRIHKDAVDSVAHKPTVRA